MADFDNATQKFGEQAKAMPMGTMVRDIAMGISDAQSQMDKSAMALLVEYGKRNIDLNGDGSKQVSLLELGFAPQFLFFQKVSIKLHMDLRFHAQEDTAEKKALKADIAGSIKKRQQDQNADDAAMKTFETDHPNATEDEKKAQREKLKADREKGEEDKGIAAFKAKNPNAGPAEEEAERKRLQSERTKTQNLAQNGTTDLQGSVAVGVAFDSSEARKFSLDASMATEVIAELVSIPAPAKLTELIAARFSREKAAA